MKKSKMFLGFSTLVLSVAAIAATKARPMQTNFYYQTANNCLIAPTPDCVNGSDPCTESISGTLYQIYTVNAGSICEDPLNDKSGS